MVATIALYAVATLVGFFLNVFLHESSHYVVAWWRGAEMIDFKPYPHVINGHKYFGSISYYSTPGFSHTKWISAAPAVTSAVMAPLWAAGAFWCPYLLPFAYWALVDHLSWWQGYTGWGIAPQERDLHDGWKFRHNSK